MNQEETIWDIQTRVIRIEKKLDKLIPEIRDVSKCIVSMRESMSCVQPSNHGRKGTMPRSRKGCFKKKEHKHKGMEELHSVDQYHSDEQTRNYHNIARAEEGS